MQTQPNVGDTPAIINIHNVACSNPNYRKEIWTGGHLQVTVMSIPRGIPFASTTERMRSSISC